MFGAGPPLREEPLIPPRLLTLSDHFSVLLLGSRDGVEEGNGGWREEASHWELLDSCDEVKEVLQRDGTPPS